MEQPIAIPVWHPGLTHQQLVDNPIEVELGDVSLAALENITVNVEASGGLTDAELRASPVPVNGTVELGNTSLAALENITVNVETTGGLTDAELRASPVTVEPLGRVTAARKIPSSTISTRVTLTVGCKRVSVRARGCDIRYAVGDNTVTADASTSHFIAQDERLDIAVTGSDSIAAVRESLAVVDGILEITELE